MEKRICPKCDISSEEFLPLDDVDEILNKDCECPCPAPEESEE